MKSTTLVSRLRILNVSLGVVALCGVAQANDLLNGNLDTIGYYSDQNNETPQYWNVEAFRLLSGLQYDGCSSETWANHTPGGSYGLFFKPFQGTPDDPITVYFYQDNPASPGAKYTLSGYAAAEANYCGRFATNDPPPQTLFVVEFLDQFGTVISSNSYDLAAAGLPTGTGLSATLFTMPQVTAPAETATVRAGAYMINGYGTSGGQAFVVDDFDLTSVAPPGAPVITNQPSHTTVSAGDTATFTVGVSNPSGVTYQWQYAGADIFDGGNRSGTASPTLTITDVSTNDVGHYRVKVTNSQGSVFSSDATLAIVGIHIYPVISIEGKIGDTYRVDYSTDLAPDTWIPLSTNTLSMSPQLIMDTETPGPSKRFYRAVYLP